MSRTFAIGDIHGAHIPLQQCLDRCGFDYENDTLITLGDICDGWPYVYECVEILLKIKNRIDIMGNHDEWFERWLRTGRHPDDWKQGGRGTRNSYLRAKVISIDDPSNLWLRNDDGMPTEIDFSPNSIPESHKEFFRNQLLFLKDKQNRLFVHGGFYRGYTLKQQEANDPIDFYWNRELWDEALSVSDGQSLKFNEDFSEIYIGHTATIHWTKFKKAPNSYVLMPTQDDDCPPMKADIIYNLDTGAGSTGRLTIMDIDTHDYWQSDMVNSIYGEYKPRG